MQVEYDFRWFKRNADYFDDWFDPNTFEWGRSRYLAEYCSEHFNKWWNSKKYHWSWSDKLASHCSKDFKIWFDAEKYNWDDSLDPLIQNCITHIDIWYDPNIFEESYDQLLIESIK